MKDFDLLFQILYICILFFIGFFLFKKGKINQDTDKNMMAEYDKNKEKYSYLYSGSLDSCPKEEVLKAVLIHCMRKEDDDYEHVFENFTYAEKVIYGIYQVELTLEGRGASLHSFFLNLSTRPYVPMIVDAYEEIGAKEVANLMKAAKHFAEVIEKDEEINDDDPLMGDYAKFSFADLTHECIRLNDSTQVHEKMIAYILEHKEDFYDKEIPEEKKGDGKDEGIINKI